MGKKKKKNSNSNQLMDEKIPVNHNSEMSISGRVGDPLFQLLNQRSIEEQVNREKKMKTMINGLLNSIVNNIPLGFIDYCTLSDLIVNENISKLVPLSRWIQFIIKPNNDLIIMLEKSHRIPYNQEIAFITQNMHKFDDLDRKAARQYFIDVEIKLNQGITRWKPEISSYVDSLEENERDEYFSLFYTLMGKVGKYFKSNPLFAINGFLVLIGYFRPELAQQIRSVEGINKLLEFKK